jgi:long-subunit acyl-CoA synthetase (AMP-forming)
MTMTEVKTAADALTELAAAAPDRPFLHQPLDGEVKTWSRADALNDARRLASGLRGLGLEPGDRVALLSKNCAEWVISDIGISIAGLVSVPIYPTAGGNTISYVLEHSGAKAIIIGRLDNPAGVEGAVPNAVVTIAMRYPSIDCAHDWDDLVAQSEPGEAACPSAGEPMTILYTSGSTGRPKGVVISYGAFAYASQTCVDVLSMTGEDRAFSYLPLAHITERAILVGPAVFAGAELYFAESLETFREDLGRASPTMFISVPRLWVQFQAAVHREIPPQRLAKLLRIPVVRGIVARKIRAKLGFANTHMFGSGSAPISESTLRWYESIGIDISEGWGMSETCGLSCSNIPFRSDRIGTIGAPIPGTEMKLSEEGEILIRGPGMLTEYYRQPELTAEAFDDDGFFRTGDKGEWLADIGAYRITGRVKEIFKSAKGKYVSPVPIESKLAANALVEQVCVMGAGLRAPVAVVVVSAAAQDLPREEVRASLGRTLEEVNATLESHEKMSHIIVDEEAWSIENGLLTPTLKIKRSLLEEKYEGELAVTDGDTVAWVAA